MNTNNKNFDFIAVKKNITISGNTILASGVYEKNVIVKDYPFLDLTNGDYFVSFTKDLIDAGTKVKYNDENYYVIGIFVPSGYYNRGVVSIGSYSYGKSRSSSDIHLRYMISKSLTDKPKDYKTVSENEFTIVSSYWFINSEGIVCKTFTGDKPNADIWRSTTGNMFKTKDEATAYRNSLIK